jgi:hypothetical protein
VVEEKLTGPGAVERWAGRCDFNAKLAADGRILSNSDVADLSDGMYDRLTPGSFGYRFVPMV